MWCKPTVCQSFLVPLPAQPVCSWEQKMNSRSSSSDQAETLAVVMTLMQSTQFSFHLAHRFQNELISPCVSCVFQMKSSSSVCGLFCYLFKLSWQQSLEWAYLRVLLKSFSYSCTEFIINIFSSSPQTHTIKVLWDP